MVKAYYENNVHLAGPLISEIVTYLYPDRYWIYEKNITIWAAKEIDRQFVHKKSEKLPFVYFKLKNSQDTVKGILSRFLDNVNYLHVHAFLRWLNNGKSNSSSFIDQDKKFLTNVPTNLEPPQPHRDVQALYEKKDVELIEDLLAINDPKIPPTERPNLQLARIGQGKFREDVLKIWNYKCAVTECSLINLLVASHIKPWRSCDKDTEEANERLDPYNGLLLSPNLDLAFDRVFISFNDDGYIIFAPSLTQLELVQLELLGIKSDMTISPTEGEKSFTLTDKHKKYLKYHREEVLKKTQ